MLTLHVDGAPDPVDALDAVVFDPGAPDGLVCASSLGWTFGPAGWCIKLIASPPSGDPDTWFFGAIICRLPGTQRGVITNDQLPRLRMYDMGDGALVFDSEVRPWDALGDAAPSRTWGVDQGTCVMFNSPWASIDNDGNPVEEGPYQYDWDPTDSQFDAWANEHSGTVVTVGPNGES
ncbi:MAG TPA: hypothetical protein VNQ77_17485 [Frankiaceae bacterium]|nr:hypothetical protein [Frankiaceae bacterium]